MDKMEKYRQELDQLVNDYGIAVQGVFYSLEHPRGFGYTVGMFNHGLPELVMMGIHPKQVTPILNDIYQEFSQHGVKLGRSEEFLGSSGGKAMPVDIVPVSDTEHLEREIVCQSVGYYLRHPVTANPDPKYLQVLWPDADGILPNEPGYNQRDFPQEIL